MLIGCRSPKMEVRRVNYILRSRFDRESPKTFFEIVEALVGMAVTDLALGGYRVTM